MSVLRATQRWITSSDGRHPPGKISSVANVRELFSAA